MKKVLSLILAVLMLLGCMSITAFAEESNGTWSYDPNTNTFTVNCTIPKKVTLNTAIPEEVSITSTNEIPGITGLFALWGKTSVENGYLYDSRNWIPAINKDDPNAVFEANTEYGYIIDVAYDPSVLQKDLSAAKIVLNGKKYSEIGVAVAYNSQNEYAEAFIVVDFGTLNADGSFTGGDFAEASTNKSGSTDITLTVAKSLTYDMVIPEDVTDLNAAGIYAVGQAKVANVKNATEKTVISYTAETTAFKCEGKTDIPASYYTDEAGQNAFPTTAVEVYKNKADAASIPTMYVGITEANWNAAENGTYHATVTFNFEAEEKEPGCAVNPEEYTMLLKIVAIEDDDVFAAIYNYADDAFTLTDNDCDCNTKDELVSLGITECAIGDCFHFHVDGTTFDTVKCTSPDELGITDIVFSVDNSGTKDYYSVPVGTSYSISNGMLTCTDSLYEGGTDFTWTLNGEAAPASGTIQNNDAFVGTPAN